MSAPDRPVLRIVSGYPDDAELAAVAIALLTGEQAEPAPQAAVRLVGGWADPAARMRPALSHGPGAWRSS